MGHDNRRAGPGGIQQGWAGSGADIGKAFAPGGPVMGQPVRRQWPKVRQVAKGTALPDPETLFPQARVVIRHHVGPKRRRRLTTAQRRADDQPRGRACHVRNGRLTGKVAQIRRHIGAPAQAPAVQGRGMADQDQFCRAQVLHGRIPSFVTNGFLLSHRIMSKTILITGGARSGKSVIAETKALSLAPRAIYIATAEVRDGEMAARVAEHRARRGAEWGDHPAPLDLAGALAATDGQGPRLVDCLTLWLTNLMLGGHDWRAAAQGLCAALPDQCDPVVIVTNEVGAGIVPDNKLAREFRDAAGHLNQMVAAVADEVILAVAGLPLKVK